MGGSCAICRFWRSKLSSISAVTYKDGLGECRRYAPRGPVNLAWSQSGTDVTHAVLLAPFPITPFDDWCGEFSKAE